MLPVAHTVCRRATTHVYSRHVTADLDPWQQLERGIHLPFDPLLAIPELRHVRFAVPTSTPVDDVAAVARTGTARRLAGTLEPGDTIAVGAGSRGLGRRVELLRGTIAGLRELGADPFVVPAMGSHGGATADGQRAMLESLGITETSVGAPIMATMDTTVVARTDTGMPLYLDTYAASADWILPVNRIKPHTCFKGPLESGCTKMAVVGFGKQPGAAQIHACGPVEMRQRLIDGIAALRATGRLLGGVASIESADGTVVDVQALTAAEVGGDVEIGLTERARGLVPALPFAEIDVLIVEQGGKDISGTTLDPNVTGRFWVNGLGDPNAPNVATIVLLDLTDISDGNALGIGLADFIPVSLAAKLDWAKTYLNCFTAGPSGVRRSRMPMVLPTEADCVLAALSMCGRGVTESKRVLRIRDTLHIGEGQVSAALLDQLPEGAVVLPS